MLLAHLKGLKKHVSNQLHELVDAMVINVVPLLMEILNQGSKEDETVLFWQLDEKLRYFGVEFMLVDHFIKIPEPV